jgi:hypothetical protein
VARRRRIKQLGASDTSVIDGDSSYSTGIDLVTDGGAAAVSAPHPVHGGETGASRRVCSPSSPFKLALALAARGRHI